MIQVHLTAAGLPDPTTRGRCAEGIVKVKRAATLSHYAAILRSSRPTPLVVLVTTVHSLCLDMLGRVRCVPQHVKLT